MGNFWPSGIELSDTQTPREILRAAQEDWRTSSDGMMELVLQDATTKSGNPMIIVHAKHVVSNRTSSLFSVVHRPDNPYPATIQPKDENLPDFLKKSYSKTLSEQVSAVMQNLSTVSTIANPWVSDTPSEFRESLVEVFNLGTVKTAILNLASQASDDEREATKE